jgi:hypothetical protein
MALAFAVIVFVIMSVKLLGLPISVQRNHQQHRQLVSSLKMIEYSSVHHPPSPY